MQKENMIPANDFCMHYGVDESFILSLSEAGVIELITLEEKPYLQIDHLYEVEKLVHLHTDLGINSAGVEAITHLLARIKTLQKEMSFLQQRIHLHE